MKANAAPMSVADYCHDFNLKKIIVNDNYQRNDGLWSSQARSFFIESILLEFPIPKIYLYTRLDLQTRQTVKEIVDGQQRTQALVAFYNNRLRLSTKLETEEVRGLKYNQLDDELKTKFLSYSLPIDQFSGVQEIEVREAFRRMNSSNVPLNDEEQRNARFQGDFKWFIIRIAEIYNEGLFKLGLFSRRDLVRMSDLKLYAEMVHVFDEGGFVTIKGKQLDDLYKKYNGAFDKEDEYENLLVSGIEAFLGKQELHQDVFLRAHMFQSAALAAVSLKNDTGYYKQAVAEDPDTVHKLTNETYSLEVLANALREPEAYPQLFDFIQASTQKTNVASSKMRRFLYLRAALAE